MRARLVLGVVLLFVLVVSTSADFTLVRTIPSPGTDVTGLDNADGVLFGVTGYDTGESCMFLADPADGDVLDVYCFTSEPPGCPETPPRYVSCAFKPWNSFSQDPLCMDTYWVGDACGDLMSFNWTDTYGLVYTGHCKPEGIGEPAGLAAYDDHVYVLDRTNGVIFRLVSCFESLCDPIELPDNIANPTALTFYGGNMFVSDAGTDLLYELDMLGVPVGVHQLGSFGSRVLSGMTFIGDHLFVASDDDEILVYEFGSGGFEVPEGDGVVVEPLPDELEIVFPTVSGSGSLYVHVADADSCPPPAGVRFLPSFYEIVTTASFDYIAQVAILAEDPMPQGVNPRLVRIFRRPSGDCMPYMDVTVAPFELVETLRDPRLARLSKRVSEDDEFSVFILGEDLRRPHDVAELKFMYLQEAIDAVGGVPVDPINLMNALKAEAMDTFRQHSYERAARLVDRIAQVAMATPEIPHTYDPDNPGNNKAGRIVARAHTLSFSLRQMVQEMIVVGPPGGPLLGMARGDDSLTLTPNPSTSGFSISFSPAGSAPVSLRIYSVDGRLVRTLLDDAGPEGHMTATWDSKNGDGVRVAVGTYFAVLSQGEESRVRKMILRK